MAMTLTYVNNYPQALLLFEAFNIPYEIITRGPNKGKLRTKPLRDQDRINLIYAERALRRAGLDELLDHKNCFRDADDNTVCTFSPYHTFPYTEKVADHPEWDWIVLTDYSIYGMMTKTFVVVMDKDERPIKITNKAVSGTTIEV